MKEEEKFYIATKCFAKGWDIDQLRYGDDLYGKESFASEIWEIVEEIKEKGRKAFYEEYSEYELY
jgi:hypothetical protein